MDQQSEAPPRGHNRYQVGKFVHAVKKQFRRSPSTVPPISILPSTGSSTTQPNLSPSPLHPGSRPATPPPSVPSTNPYQSLLPSAVRSGHSSVSSTGLTVLKTVVSTVKEVSDSFPLLKAAAAGFLIVLDRITKVEGAKEELRDVANMLAGLVGIIEAHKNAERISLHERGSRLDSRIDQISRTIKMQGEEINSLLERGITRRVIEAESDIQKIAQAFRTISNLVAVLTLDAVMDSQSVLEGIQTGVEKLNNDAVFRKLRDIPNISGCLPGTREKVLVDLLTWAQSPDVSRVFWLSGGAGYGARVGSGPNRGRTCPSACGRAFPGSHLSPSLLNAAR